MKKTLLPTIVLCTAFLAAIPGCTTTPVQKGAAVGGALGAGAGAIIGNQIEGKSGEGAILGGALGGLTGALIGDKVGARPGVCEAGSMYAAKMRRGHYETRVVTSNSGEKYEERVWVADN